MNIPSYDDTLRILAGMLAERYPDEARAGIRRSTIETTHRRNTSDLLGFICDELGITRQEIASPSRASEITYARRIAAYILHHIAGVSVSGIARMLDRHHTSVLSMLKNPPNNERFQLLVGRATEFWSGTRHGTD